MKEHFQTDMDQFLSHKIFDYKYKNPSVSLVLELEMLVWFLELLELESE